jgi:hypothetical protein
VGEGPADEPRANQRLTVAQAAATLGITEGAVRSRLKRGTLPTMKEGGTVFVLWGGGTSSANQPPNTDVPTDQSELVEELRDRVRYLERQVEEERDSRRRADTLLAQLMQRIPELEAPEKPRESPERTESPGPRDKALHRRGERSGARSAPALVAEDVRPLGISEKAKK